LDISVIETGRMNLSPTTIHFATFLEGIANIIRLRAEAKHLAFQMETPDTLPLWVAADETRLRQILLNLLSNAVKFTPAGKVVLRLERRDSPATALASPPVHQVLLRFEVRDTGIGIEQDQIDRIFQPFEQIHQIKHETGGTGLGLAISRQLVQLMGGELHVESQPGRGSVFWFEAALAVTGPADDVMPPERVITGYSGPRRRVLIADDIASNRLVLVEMLARVGFETIEAMDGQQVVDLAQETRPDLILIDRRMPGLNGFQAALQIRQVAGLEKVIIITVTANVSEESEAMCRRLGINAFLPKPVYWPRLAALLKKHLKIEWVYAWAVQAQSDEDSENLVPPSAEELNILYDMARRGNLRAIADRASRLETTDVRLRPFASRLRQLAQAFEDRAVLALIEQFIQE
jgi:CheY-like chemotaxis protein